MGLKINPTLKINNVMTRKQTERKLYKSIVIVMSIFLPAGVWFGLLYDQLIPGILLGNTAGLLLGIGVSRINRGKTGIRP
nr:hypothetical protein [uncultured bacterium]